MIFTDAHERTIDDKNRIQIPAEYRKGMDPEVDGEAFYLCLGERQNTLSMYPSKLYEQRAKALMTGRIPGDDALAFEQTYFSVTSRLEVDKQGRVVIPERQLAMVNLGKEITLAGANDRIELWRTEEYREFIGATVRHRWHDLHKFLRTAGSEWKDKAN